MEEMPVLHTKWCGKHWIHLDEVASTNDYLKQGDFADGTAVIADRQTAGKGRQGKSWSEAPVGQAMYLSVLFHSMKISDMGLLPLLCGLATARSLGAAARIKWPNDVVVSRKKICGILTEMTMKQDKIGCAVIGVGINVNMESFPEEMADKATSLYLESGHPFDRAQVVGLVMKHFEENYERFVQTEDLSGLKPDYEKMLANLNQPVRVLDQNDPYEGIARGINAGGELLVERADGTVEEVNSGEVSVRGLYSYV